MHPTDHTSIALVYSEAFNITSGALYHLVTTYSVLNSVSYSNPLANPKSHIFRSQFLFNNKLLGLRSLWITLAECMYNSPLNN